ncbi:glycosyltransferase [Candidatus Halobeggiatoa sp. HSG11]|nr:glycosyltransferase [Candidatus Halobeggiatoa sp. HSG11]
MSTKSLTWSVVIPTYKRQEVLLKCLRFAAQQTLPAKEIIVVDASPEWETTKNIVEQELMAKYPQISWLYVKADYASSATQRNQGIKLNNADVVFLIDDDSFMYPNCAKEVVKIYAQDTYHKVAGVMPKLEALPPDVKINQVAKSSNINFKIITIKLRALAKRIIGDDDIFIPYDFSFPKYSLPTELTVNAHPVPMIHGARMSYRKEILQQIKFDETLRRYAVNEDNDVCYRASRIGMLLHALDAQIFHLQHTNSRLSRLTTTALWGLNQTVLHRFHNNDIERFKTDFSKLLWKRLLTQTIKDILDRRWSLPSTRGILFAMRNYKQILAKTPAELRSWYPKFQQTLLDRD